MGKETTRDGCGVRRQLPTSTMGAPSRHDPPRGLNACLQELRRERGFRAEVALGLKQKCINEYLTRHDLDAAVIGVSGGVDSAVALGLLLAASREPESPLRRVVGVVAPIHGPGATGQARAQSRAQRVLSALGGELWQCDLSAVQSSYVAAMGHHSCSTPWSEGQLLSIVRTPALYYAAAMLQADGHRSLVVGTTNRDEGAYLGFYGKASDGMVDLQVISDLHKSEVVALARLLGVPEEVIEAAPTGDVFDGRTDLEMIGAPYWAVELFLLARCAGVRVEGADARENALWRSYSELLEARHTRNAHKYAVGTPSVHLDVYARRVPGGWQ